MLPVNFTAKMVGLIAMRVWLAVAAGMLLGLYAAVWGPIACAYFRNESVFHQGHYADWVFGLLPALPILGGGLMGALAYRGVWRRAVDSLIWTAGIVTAMWIGLGAIYEFTR